MCQAMMEFLQDRIDEMVDKSKEDGIRIGECNGIRIGEEKGILLAKQVLRMNADGADYETIALKCMLTVDEVKDILSY